MVATPVTLPNLGKWLTSRAAPWNGLPHMVPSMVAALVLLPFCGGWPPVAHLEGGRAIAVSPALTYAAAVPILRETQGAFEDTRSTAA